MNNRKIKPICFYLPQYHEIPENDKAYGKGFTEWTNVKKAKPLFPGHYQPRIPLNNNYYTLDNPDIMAEQAKVAKEYGIYGFCFYHYWFKNGKKLLEKPVEMFLENKQIDINYCLCWANENWTKKWDGGNNEVIVEQDYGNIEDLYDHVDYLCEFFADERYIKLDDAPLLIIYKPELIPHLRKYISLIRKRAKQNGYKNIKLAVQYPKYIFDNGQMDIFDYYIEFEPQYIISAIKDEYRKSFNKIAKRIILDFGGRNFVEYIENKRINKVTGKEKSELEIRNYNYDWKKIIDHKVKGRKIIPGAFVDWDNTPRNIKGRAYKGATPEQFGNYIYLLAKKINKEYSSSFLFINAWNEWAEGAYLEPDEKYQYSYLNALKKALEKYNED